MTTDTIIWSDHKHYNHNNGIADPIRLMRGRYECQRGTFWAWPVDGYYDLHFVNDKDGYTHPQGDDVIGELLTTLTDCRNAARYETNWSRKNAWWWNA